MTHHDESSASKTRSAPRDRKRSFSQVVSAFPTQRSGRIRNDRVKPRQHHTAQFCTQKCLLGLQQGGKLDRHCPNFRLHQQGTACRKHLINAETLVRLCTPMGPCATTGAPFKVTCTAYGYTVVGKGTTSRFWHEVEPEADVYHILRQAQGSAVPVFLGKINLAQTYYHDQAGPIRHMLIMAWGGIAIRKIDDSEALAREVSRSKKEIRTLGVLHQDLHSDNILWNAELGRALIIDFHICKLDHPPMKKRVKAV